MSSIRTGQAARLNPEQKRFSRAELELQIYCLDSSLGGRVLEGPISR